MLGADPVPGPRGWRRGPLAGLRLLRKLLPPLAAGVWAVPLLVLVGTSVHGARDAATRPWWAAPVRGDQYASLVDPALGTSLLLTGGLAVTVTLVVLAVAVPAGYALASVVPLGGRVVGALLLAAAVVPVQVIAGPVNQVLDRVHLAGTVPGLGLVHVALGLPFAILVVRNALDDVPPALARTARLRARREVGVLWRLLPAAGPALLGVAVLEFVQVWNDLVVGLLFAGPQATPLGLLLYGQSRQFVANSGQLAATSVVMSVLPLVLIVLARRQVITALVGAIRQ